MKKYLIFLIALLTVISFTFISRVQAEENTDQPPELDPKLVSCLKGKLGETIFSALKSGRKPSSEEIEGGQPCFDQFSSPGFQKPTKSFEESDFSPQTAKCLKSTLGSDFLKQMQSIKSRQEAEAFREKTKNCFGMPPPKGEGDEQNPEELKKTKDCLVAAVGQAQVDKMFTGEKPELGSEIFNKIENSGCFKRMNFRPRGPKENLSPETESCIKGILGGSLMKEPSEDQKKEIGQKCFGGRGFGGEGRVSLPAEVESCLKSKVGEKFKEEPEAMSEDDKRKAGECFRQNNFRPPGSEDQPNRPEMNMNPNTKACIEGIIGSDIRSEPNEEQRKQIGEKCFKGPQNLNENIRKPNSPDGQVPGVTGPPPDNDCVKRVTGDQKEPFSQELRDRINRECFGGSPPSGQPITPTYPNNTTQPPPTNQQPPMPGGCTDQACVKQYCQNHQAECDQVGGGQKNFLFSIPRLLRSLFQ